MFNAHLSHSRARKIVLFLLAWSCLCVCEISGAQTQTLTCEALFRSTPVSARRSTADRLRGLFLGRTAEEAFDRYLRKAPLQYVMVKRSSVSGNFLMGASVVGIESGGRYRVLPQGTGPEITVAESDVVVPGNFMGITLPGVITRVENRAQYMVVGFRRDGIVVVGRPSELFVELTQDQILPAQ